MFVLGLTGGIASGKSTTAHFFVRLGARLLNADQVGHQLLVPNSPVLAAVVAEFGSEFLKADGSLDRKRLGQFVFNNQKALARLNALMHPPMAAAMARTLAAWQAEDSDCIVILEAAVLFEAGWDKLTHQVLVMYADTATQLRRLTNRDGLSTAAATARIQAQLPWPEKLSRANYIIDSRLPLPAIERAVGALWKELNQCKSGE